MNLEKHVSDICKNAFYHIRNISKARRFLSYDSTKTLVHAFVTSRLDSCNALLFGLPSYSRLILRLQHVLNSAARLVTLSRKAEHATPLLMELHWLPVEQRICYKIVLGQLIWWISSNPFFIWNLMGQERFQYVHQDYGMICHWKLDHT
jgi:hypothetical protein